MGALRSMTSLRKAGLIGAAVLVGLLVASWMFVLSPRNAAVAAANEKVDAASAANDALRGTIETRRAMQAQLPELRKVEKALAGRFPPTAEQAKMFKMVTAAAGQAGLAPSAISNLTVSPPASASGAGASAQLPGVAAPVGEIASQPVSMDVAGTEDQIRRLVANLEQLPRAFQVTTVSVNNTAATAETPASTTATVTGEMFVMPKLADPTVKTTVSTKPAATKTTAKKS